MKLPKGLQKTVVNIANVDIDAIAATGYLTTTSGKSVVDMIYQYVVCPEPGNYGLVDAIVNFINPDK